MPNERDSGVNVGDTAHAHSSQGMIAEPSSVVKGMARTLKQPETFKMERRKADDWDTWLSVYDIWATATGVTRESSDIQAAILLSVAGPGVQKLVATLKLDAVDRLNPVKIRSELDKQFKPKMNYTFERFVFNEMTQEQSESIEDYLVRLKAQADKCAFYCKCCKNCGEVTKSLLIDRIILGTKHKESRQNLLSKSDLTLDKLVSILQSAEATNKQLNQIDGYSEANISRVYNDSRQSKKHGNFKFKNKSMKEDKGPECGRCGLNHRFDTKCPAEDKVCNICKRQGHFARKCRSPNQTRVKTAKLEPVRDNETSRPESPELREVRDKSRMETQLFNRTVVTAIRKSDEDYMIELELNGKKVSVLMDTGADTGVIGRKTLDSIGGTVKACNELIHGFSKSLKTQVTQETRLRISYCGKSVEGRFMVLDEDIDTILGKKEIRALDLISVNKSVVSESDSIIRGYEELFGSDIGCVTEFEYRIDIDEDAVGVQRPPRKVPLKIADEVREKLKSLEQQGILKDVNKTPTKFVSHMLVVDQRGKKRICLDPTDLNVHIKRRHYPLRTFEQVRDKLSGSRFFRKFDCSKGFWQIRLHPESQLLTTFSTEWGRYCFTRMPFGIKSAPEVYQRLMEEVLEGLEGVIVSADDILVFADTVDILDVFTRNLLERLMTRGIRLNKDKCVLTPLQEIKFLGHIVSSDGVKPDPDKVDVLKKMKPPNNVEELKKFLGMITYLSKFIPNFSELTAPLRELQKKEIAWCWDDTRQEAFKILVEALDKDSLLRYFDVKKPVVLQTDASKHSVGAVLLQDDKPIYFASKSLTPLQMNYGQIDKECLAIVFGCMKFHQYIYGTDLTVESDHKPLETIFRKPLWHSPPRLQSMRLRLQAYNLKVVYKPGKEMTHADILSRNIENPGQLELDYDENWVCISTLCITESMTKLLDDGYNGSQEMKDLRQVVLNGWPAKFKSVDRSLRKY